MQNKSKENAGQQLDELEIIFQQLAQIDRGYSSAESCIRIQELLHVIGVYTGAERVYIFETIESEQIFTNTFEWCAAGVEPQIDNLQMLSAEDMPVWYQTFREGESIAIQDLEEIRKTMPLEYEILKPQGIQSELSFPIICRQRLIGFIGLDNPDMTNSQRFQNLLSVVGRHLGSTWVNSHVEQLLKENQDMLAENQQKLAEEQRFMEVLCRDFTTVYYLNLLTGIVRILKIDGKSNTSRMEDLSIRENCEYEPFLKLYADQYVTKEYAQELKEKLSLKNLRESLKDRERIYYRYRSIPNERGYQYFEAQAIRIDQSDDNFEIMLGFRHIDDIVAEEQRHQEELTKALEETRQSNQTISAISKIYVSILRVNLVRDFYEEISGEDELHRTTGKTGSASEKMREISETLVAAEYRDRVRKFFDLSTLQERMEEEDTVAAEYIASDGNWHMTRFIAEKRDMSGRVTHVLYVTRVISDSKRREQSWIIIAEEANRQNAAKTDFLSRMAHDIRTPMNAIRGFTQIAKANVTDSQKVMEGLQKIEVAEKYLQQIVDDVLDLTRIESGQMRLEPVDTKVSEVFQDFAGLMKSTQSKKLEFICRKHDIIYDDVRVDSMRLKQIYTNLLSNAIKYTPEGGTVTFEVYEEEIPQSDKVRLISVIQDTGIGMTPEYMKEMYHKFSREVDTRVNKVRGTGLGLSIVKQLVDLMQGTIEATSELHKGTTFRVALELPYLTEVAETEPEAETKISADICRGMHLLVAEDNDLNYEVVHELLDMYGITCVHAENGAVCVEKFQSAKPRTFDAILMDMQMPVMDGLEATRAIRHMEQNGGSAIPIIAMTANAFSSDVQKCMDAGMNAHLAKPFDIEQLLDVLAANRR